MMVRALLKQHRPFSRSLILSCVHSSTVYNPVRALFKRVKAVALLYTSKFSQDEYQLRF